MEKKRTREKWSHLEMLQKLQVFVYENTDTTGGICFQFSSWASYQWGDIPCAQVLNWLEVKTKEGAWNQGPHLLTNRVPLGCEKHKSHLMKNPEIGKTHSCCSRIYRYRFLIRVYAELCYSDTKRALFT